MHLHLDNCISGIDFNPSGELVATIDCSGVCLIPDMNTSNYRFHINMSADYSTGKKYEELQFFHFLLLYSDFEYLFY